jgi:multidrug efflux pump subunit AcrB
MLAQMTGGNTDVSGGFKDVGRRQYTIRFSGKYDLDQLRDMVLTWRDGQPIHLHDVADVSIELRDSRGSLNQNGGPSIAMNAQPEQNVNVLEVMTDLKAVVAELNEGVQSAPGCSSARTTTRRCTSPIRSTCCATTCCWACCWPRRCCGGSCAAGAPR